MNANSLISIFTNAGLAASANVAGVALGGTLGHVMCTGGAVLGGRQMAAYVAEKTLAVRHFKLTFLQANPSMQSGA